MAGAIHTHAPGPTGNGVARADRTRAPRRVVPDRDHRRAGQGRGVAVRISDPAISGLRRSDAHVRSASRLGVRMGRRHASLRVDAVGPGNRAHLHRHLRRARQGRARRDRLARVSRPARATRSTVPRSPGRTKMLTGARSTPATSSGSGPKRRRSDHPKDIRSTADELATRGSSPSASGRSARSPRRARTAPPPRLPRVRR